MFDKTMVRGSMAAITTTLIWALSVSSVARGDTMTFTTTGTGSVTIPAGYDWTNVTVQCWGAGGGGGGNSGAYTAGGGGGGGAYASKTYAALLPGDYEIYVGAGGHGGGSWTDGAAGGGTIWNFGGTQDILVTGGSGGGMYGSGGASGLVLAGMGYPGGNGGASYCDSNLDYYSGGGGGGSAGPGGTGGNGANGANGGGGGTGYGSGGSGGFYDGYNYFYDGPGGFPGGGGGGFKVGYGVGSAGTYAGSEGANGEIIINYTQEAVPEPSTIALLCVGAIGLLIMARRNK